MTSPSSSETEPTLSGEGLGVLGEAVGAGEGVGGVGFGISVGVGGGDGEGVGVEIGGVVGLGCGLVATFVHPPTAMANADKSAIEDT